MSRSEEKGWCWGLGSQQGAVGSEGWMNLLSEYVDGLALEQRSGLPRRCLCEVLVGKWMGRPYLVSGIRLSDLCLTFIVILFTHT